MGWLRDTFPKPGDDLTKVERVRYAQAYILQILEGYLMPDKSRNLIHLRWLLKLIDFKVAGKLMAPEMLNDEHKIDLWRLNTHWPVFHSKYIKIWENRYDNIPTREPIIIPKPFKFKDNGGQGGPINSAHAITGPTEASDNAHTTASLYYAKCVS
ncbi:hypothetical protein Gogos_021943 [Gossypium gossypioides]|uniref:Uncharacterized protein n=1 Tax=Gossypium gossypioides TaxID=34282 RepID=A0A7J9D1P0_GOSGO|nr:hypothetical protein [Gossypium gossypioides]